MTSTQKITKNIYNTNIVKDISINTPTNIPKNIPKNIVKIKAKNIANNINII